MSDETSYLDFDEDLEDPQLEESGDDSPGPAPDAYKSYLGANGNLEDPLKDPDDNPDDTQVNTDDDLITAFLKSRGVENPEEMKFEGDNGEEEVINFNDLSREEQLNILSNLGNSEQEDNNIESQLDEDEITLLNEIRTNDLSVKEYLDWYARQAIQNYLDSNLEDTVDNLSDEELFLADLKDTLPDLTDEEVLQILDQEKANENLFSKKVERLRNIYKEKEEHKRQTALVEEQAQREEEYNKARESLDSTIEQLDNIGEFNIEEEEKEQIAEFILGTDKAGVGYLYKAINDPETLVKMAWFALYGDSALESYSNYFKDRIQEYSEANYRQGYEDALAGKEPKNKKLASRTNNPQVQPKQKTVVSRPSSSKKKGEEREAPAFIPLNTPSYMIDLD